MMAPLDPVAPSFVSAISIQVKKCKIILTLLVRGV